jgi:hypothetical protein
MANLEKPLDAEPLVKLLTEKTLAQKILWEPTANQDSFLATVSGHTFKVFLASAPDWDQDSEGIPCLALVNEKGTHLWSLESKEIAGGLWPLFRVVRRVAYRLDAKLDEAIDALKKL